MKRLWRCVSQCPNAVVSILLLLPKQFVKQACLRMFLDLDLIGRFHIDYEVLCRWLLSVKKNYRNVTYHNWRHAFNVAQMMFAIVTVSFVVFSQSVSYWREHFLCHQGTQWWKVLGEIEVLSLIMACLCHDLDHRGTNNSFQIKYALRSFLSRGVTTGHLTDIVVWTEPRRHSHNCTRLRRWSAIISTNVSWFWVVR